MNTKFSYKVKLLKWVTCELKEYSYCTQPELIDYGRGYRFKVMYGKTVEEKVIPLNSVEEFSWTLM